MKDQNLYKQFVITKTEKAAKDVKLFYLKSKNGDEIMYKAGQYFTFIHKDENEEIRRSYSIASAPVLNEEIVIGVKRITNGFFSRKLVDHATVGDVLLTQGAAGFFTLPDNLPDNSRLFFFAGGSGIIPIFSLLKEALHTSAVPIILVYSNHSKENTIFYNELNELILKFPERLKIEFLFSNAKNLNKAHLHASLIEEIIKLYNADPKTLFYICGPESYMRLCIYTLQRNGIDPLQIRKEIFNTSKKIFKSEPPNKDPHEVKLEYRNNHYKLNVQYPITILRAAKNNSIELPFSCETGRCGNCAAICKGGKVWMSNNEVLTDKDLANGLILTCTSYPITDDIVILID